MVPDQDDTYASQGFVQIFSVLSHPSVDPEEAALSNKAHFVHDQVRLVQKTLLQSRQG